MIKVLHVLPRLYPGGGIDSFFINYFRNMPSDDFQIDVICHEVINDTYVKEVEARGGTVTVLDHVSLGNTLRIHNVIKQYFNEQAEQYDIVHCNMANAAYMYLSAAQAAGVPVRILHSHQSEYADRFSHKIRNIPLVAWGKRFATHNVAASRLAGDFLFGQGNYLVVPNAIDTEAECFDSFLRLQQRKQMGLTDDAKIVGVVGRMTPQKNQQFALHLLKALNDKSVYMVFLGDGDDMSANQRLAKDLNIAENVRFLGNQPDLHAYYCAMDALIMPSLYEGLPLTLVESQAAGLPAMASTGISSEAKLSDFVDFYNLDEGPAKWTQPLQELLSASPDRRQGARQVAQSGYDIHAAASRLAEFYKSGVNEKGANE